MMIKTIYCLTFVRAKMKCSFVFSCIMAKLSSSGQYVLDASQDMGQYVSLQYSIMLRSFLHSIPERIGDLKQDMDLSEFLSLNRSLSSCATSPDFGRSLSFLNLFLDR
jgi:hypothetical protein